MIQKVGCAITCHPAGPSRSRSRGASHLVGDAAAHGAFRLLAMRRARSSFCSGVPALPLTVTGALMEIAWTRVLSLAP
jgi:hypothetical protein